jgi:hypothetical protein
MTSRSENSALPPKTIKSRIALNANGRMNKNAAKSIIPLTYIHRDADVS